MQLDALIYFTVSKRVITKLHRKFSKDFNSYHDHILLGYKTALKRILLRTLFQMIQFFLPSHTFHFTSNISNKHNCNCLILILVGAFPYLEFLLRINY